MLSSKLKKQKTVLLCTNCAFTVRNFRMPILKALKQNGYRVEVITQYDGYENEIMELADKVYPLFISRKGINPFIDILTFINILICLMKVNPDIYISYTIKPVIYGSIAARLLNIKTIPTITGLGTVFIKKNWITILTKKMYSISLKKVSRVLFQNKTDLDLFVAEKLLSKEIADIVPGSGIDTNKFVRIGDLPNQDPVFLLIARMIWDKGIGEYIEASRSIKKDYPNARFQLLGPAKVINRTAISMEVIQKWVKEGVIEYLGAAYDVKPFILSSNCIVLPSYREGLSRVLLEALAMSTPIITTDVPGCRELVDNKINGYLCEPRNAQSLESKMRLFLSLDDKAQKEMGYMGRIKAKKEFHISIVVQKYIGLINKLTK